MAWVRIDDGFPEHPKVAVAGDEAGWMFVCGLAYCARALTDGFIPEGQAVKLTGLKAPLRLAARLVETGLWEREPDGFRVHDYLAYQPSAAQILQRRRNTTERVKKHRSNTHCNAVTNRGVTLDVLAPPAQGQGFGLGNSTTERDQGGTTEVDASYVALSEKLAANIRAVDAKAKCDPHSNAWLSACRLLVEKDGRSVEQIEQALDWLQAGATEDARFWSAVVLSMPTLRAKFTKLVAVMNRPQASRGQRESPSEMIRALHTANPHLKGVS